MKHTLRRALSSLLALVMALTVILPVAIPSVSAIDMAEYEQKTYYKNGASPMAAKPTTVTLNTGKAPTQSEVNYTLSLDGTWKMTSTGKVSDLAAGKGWEKAYDARCAREHLHRSHGRGGHRGSLPLGQHEVHQPIQREELVFPPHLHLRGQAGGLHGRRPSQVHRC